MTASWAERSSLRASTRSSTSLGSTAIGAAIRTGRSAAHSSSRARTPERPASNPSQVLCASPPSGVVAPIPVMTTLVRDIRSAPCGFSSWSGSGALDVGHGVADGLEVLGLLVGDADAELLLGGVDDLDHRQGVHVQVVGERLVELDVLGGDAGDLVHDLGQVGADLFGGGHVRFSLG